ncbi:hypothetical protein [Candidatus Nitrosocosmicus arcticus]|uniref:Uncharacterized protein n=1 Tax=Candidatus Nitrosocosmicus arcticus TaxID=2035267 RepID=A0A557SWS1_9ARCH|nr:hypothetical protein [Candidatus Nitrosocosmicus arcticus]TVP41053.1 hypothetical protein NARC_40012 [Candidatus Nitrosocosmicus arcticus]
MLVNFSRYQILRLVVIVGLIPVSAIQGTTLITSVFADNLCLGPLACSAVGGSGGRGGDTGDAISGDIGPGGSCFAKNHVTIGDECGGSTGSSEPRSGSGDHSMNGGRGGEAHNTVRS